LPEIIRDGDTGWLVPPRNPLAIARALREPLGNPEEARRRTARGRELARHLVDVEKTGREVVAIYGKVLDVTGSIEPVEALTLDASLSVPDVAPRRHQSHGI
jgi:hypothetical protein